MKRDFYLFDSHLKTKVRFEPEFADEARIYLCGPTVYDDAHLGHARSAISFDLLRRTLTQLGCRTIFTRNITDIDDKILNKMEHTHRSLADITSEYAQSYHNDMERLGVQSADIEPKATEHIAPMIILIGQLIANGAAYKTASGDIYFDVTKDDEYGLLSNETQDETQSRVSYTDEKKNGRDFALWKAAKSGDTVFFESPFGNGRPGWHLECSAMVQTHLFRSGAAFACDIHAGGMDLFFPHHENEAAQTRAGYKNRLAKYWMHNGFVRINGQKMSKSLGNGFFIKDALKLFQAEVLRFYLMSIHYRAGLNFADSDMLAAKKRLDRLYRLKKRLDIAPIAPETTFENELLEAMSDDMNISKALAVVDGFIANANDQLDNNPKDKTLKAQFAGNAELIRTLLGIGNDDPYVWFQWGIDESIKNEVETLIAERAQAKSEKDYQLADQIREQISQMGIALMDLTTKTVWEKI